LNDSLPTIATTLPPTTTTIRSTAAPQSPWDCNFEQGDLCSGWTHDLTANFKWQPQQGSTGSVNTGPSVG
jgi:hypothetical protein